MSNSSMDPFDEFEFKPLTDGLGFHKKAVHLKEEVRRSRVVDDELRGVPQSMPPNLSEAGPASPTFDPPAFEKRHTFEDVLAALEKAPLPKMKPELSFTETFARETPAPTPRPAPMPTREAYRQNPSAQVNLQSPASVSPRRGAADSPKRKVLQAASISLPSAFLDFVIVLALAIVFLVATLAVTKVDLNLVLKNLDHDPMTQLSMGMMFLAVMQMYVVSARSFFGRTLGEWTFDLQIGADQEQRLGAYPLRVALRSFLTTATGLVVLPLASLLFRRDLAGACSGVRLYRQRV